MGPASKFLLILESDSDKTNLLFESLNPKNSNINYILDLTIFRIKFYSKHIQNQRNSQNIHTPHFYHTNLFPKHKNSPLNNFYLNCPAVVTPKQPNLIAKLFYQLTLPVNCYLRINSKNLTKSQNQSIVAEP